MGFFLRSLLLLPVLEIIGFIVIGGEIGLGWSLLWLTGSFFLGLFLLNTYGRAAWSRPLPEAGGEAALLQDMFDGLCLLAAALLLIVPGFVSDFLALPFLLPAARGIAFRLVQKNPAGFKKQYADSRARYAQWSTRAQQDRSSGKTTVHTVIEGTFRQIDSEGRKDDQG